MGRPKAVEPMEAINVAVSKRLKAALRDEAVRRSSDLSPFCRILIEEGWDLYQSLGWEKFERQRRLKMEDRVGRADGKSSGR